MLNNSRTHIAPKSRPTIQRHPPYQQHDLSSTNKERRGKIYQIQSKQIKHNSKHHTQYQKKKNAPFSLHQEPQNARQCRLATIQESTKAIKAPSLREASNRRLGLDGHRGSSAGRNRRSVTIPASSGGWRRGGSSPGKGLPSPTTPPPTSSSGILILQRYHL